MSSAVAFARPDGRPGETLVEQVMALQVPSQPDRPHVDRPGAALQVHRLLARVARCRGALDVALGDRLAALTEGDRLLRLGFVSLGDYARERLHMPPRRAQGLARLSRQLGDRPLLDSAVRQGVLSARRAQAVLPVALGEEEARWVELALSKTVTVRGLEALVQAERDGSGEQAALAPEPFRSLRVELGEEQSRLLELALEMAGQLLAPRATKWERLQAVCQEYLGSFPTERDEPLAERASRAAGRSGRMQEAVEQAHGYWRLLTELAPPEPVEARKRVRATDAFELDRELCELGRARAGWDELVGRLGLLVRTLALWRELGFASLGHYCREQLGMSPRALGQRAWLEERLCVLPELRQAMQRGDIGYERARLIAQVARGKSIARWLEWSEGRTALTVRRAVEQYRQAPQHQRERAAPWLGSERCVPKPASSLAELLRSPDATPSGQRATAPKPSCAAAEGEGQMCAPATGRAAGAQMCAPRWGTLRCFEPRACRRASGRERRLRMPQSVLELVWVAISEVRLRTGRWLEAGECLEVLAAHFLAVWLPNLEHKKRQTLSQRIVERDRGRCTVPGCSRRAEQAHHIRYRSRGGGDEEGNLTAECAAHHLAAEHRGFIEVSGRAPDRLIWKLGVRAGQEPLLVFAGERWVRGGADA